MHPKYQKNERIPYSNLLLMSRSTLNADPAATSATEVYSTHSAATIDKENLFLARSLQKTCLAQSISLGPQDPVVVVSKEPPVEVKIDASFTIELIGYKNMLFSSAPPRVNLCYLGGKPVDSVSQSMLIDVRRPLVKLKRGLTENSDKTTFSLQITVLSFAGLLDSNEFSLHMVLDGCHHVSTRAFVLSTKHKHRPSPAVSTISMLHANANANTSSDPKVPENPISNAKPVSMFRWDAIGKFLDDDAYFLHGNGMYCSSSLFLHFFLFLLLFFFLFLFCCDD